MLKWIAIVFVLITAVSAQWDDDIPITRREMERRAEEQYIHKKNRQIFRHYHDTEIGRDELISGNVVVNRGDLDIWGEIDGDVLVYKGDVNIYRHAVVAGHITCIGGHISQHQNSLVSGNQIETSERNIFRERGYYHTDYQRREWSYSKRDKYSTLPLGPLNDRFIFRYNRVQGVFLGLEVPKSIAGRRNRLSAHGFAGYGFEEKKVRYRFGLDRYFFDRRDYRFEIGASIYDLTDTRDDWLITPLENTLASILIHEDFQDFYNRKGFDVHFSQNITIFLKSTLTFRNDDYRSLKNNTEWAIFGGNKKFRINPEIDEGNMRSLTGEIYLDTRNDQEWPRFGWYAKASMEYSNSRLGSDFSFNQYILELRHYMPISRAERFDFRIKTGSSDGILPLQKQFQIGGLSTLRGFEYKEFIGDRMLLANFEYSVSPANFSRDILFFDEFRFILFTDVGTAWFTPDDSDFLKGFERLTWNSVKTNIGFAFSDWKGHFRLDLAKRTDTNRKPWVFAIRIAKPF